MSYKEITFIDDNNQKITCMCETQGKYTNTSYTSYFRCGECKNQSVGDDEPYYCNNQNYKYNELENGRIKVYCTSYKRENKC